MECALACQATYGCEYFVYGNGLKKERCYWEKTAKSQNEVCPEGWEEDHYDFYRLNEDAIKGYIDRIELSDNNHYCRIQTDLMKLIQIATHFFQSVFSTLIAPAPRSASTMNALNLKVK